MAYPLTNWLSGQARTRRKRRVNGFWIGLALVLVGLSLMGYRTYDSYQQARHEQAAATGSFANLSTVLGMKKAAPAPAAVKPTVPSAAISAPAALAPPPMTPHVPTFVHVPLRDYNPRFGRVDAPVEVVVLGNLVDPGSREVLAAVRRVVARYPSGVNLTFKFASTQQGAALAGKQLNPVLESALFASVAEYDGRFWEFYDKLQLARKHASGAAAYVQALEGIGFDMQELRGTLARYNDLFLHQVEQDMQDVAALNMQNIPVVVVNGQLMGSDVQTLPEQIDAAVTTALGRQ